jgi:hypothetical protein
MTGPRKNDRTKSKTNPKRVGPKKGPVVKVVKPEKGQTRKPPGLNSFIASYRISQFREFSQPNDHSPRINVAIWHRFELFPPIRLALT